MPERRRLYGRLTDARLVTRAIAHLAVIGLVAFTSAIGIAAAHGQSTASGDLGMSLVSSVRGAATSISPLTAYAYEFAPQVGRAEPDPDPLRMPLHQLAPTPKPTPVPLKKAAPFPGSHPRSPDRLRRAAGRRWTAGSSRPAAAGFWRHAHVASGRRHDQPVLLSGPPGHRHRGSGGQHGRRRRCGRGHLGRLAEQRWRPGGRDRSLNGITTVYNHLGSIWVGAGQAVGRGEGIAVVGCTGICTGPHVHFEVIVGGVLVNPLRYL